MAPTGNTMSTPGLMNLGAEQFNEPWEQGLKPGAIPPPPGLQAASTPESGSDGAVQAETVPAWVSGICDAAVQRASERYAQKMEEIWGAAEQMLQEIDNEHMSKTSVLEDELKRMNQRQERLEEERGQLKKNISMMLEKLNSAAAESGGAPVAADSVEPMMLPPPGLPLLTAMPPAIPPPPPLDKGHAAMLAGEPATAKAFAPKGAAPAWEPAATTPVAAWEAAAIPGMSAAATKPALSNMGMGPVGAIPPPPGMPPPTAATLNSPRSQSGQAVGMQSPQPKRNSVEVSEAEGMGMRSPMPAATRRWTEAGMRSPPAGSHRSSTPQPPLTPQRTPKLTPHGTPRSSVGMHTPKTPAVPQSPYVIFEGGGSVFGFMLRRADGVDLGIDVTHNNDDKALHVQGVRPGGAIEAWNRLCSGGPAAGKAVVAGDKIVQVNAADVPEAMLAECREKQLLRITVVRGDPDCAIPAIWGDNATRDAKRFSAKPQANTLSGFFPPAPYAMNGPLATPPFGPAMRFEAPEFFGGLPAAATTN